MLRSYQNLRGIVTLFHLPTSQTSNNLLKYIKKTYPDPATRNFDIEVSESKPTVEQAKSILTYYQNATNKQTTDTSEQSAQSAIDLESQGIQRPLLVDWDHGRIVANDLEQSKKLLDVLAHQKEEN